MAEQVTPQFPDGAFSALSRSPAEFAGELDGECMPARRHEAIDLHNRMERP